MALMTAQEYIESLRKLNTRVYMFGEKIENWVDHPMIRPSINCVAMTYELAQNPEYADLMTVTSNLTGKKVNRFTHLHQSTEDLMNKVKMQRLLGQKTASCFQRCVGMDAFNAVFSTTYEIDEKYNTKYHENFVNFLKFVQDNDLTVDGAMTDPKGDRSKAPSQQADPDMYVHVVERRPDGIVVCGAKCHQTGSINSHWHIFMPTISMGEAELRLPDRRRGHVHDLRPSVLRHPEDGGERLYRRRQRQVWRPGGSGGAGPRVHPQRVHLPQR